MIKNELKSLAFRGGLLINKCISSSQVMHFINRFRENYVSVELVRVGGDGDGGYLLPNLIEDIDICFSPGVDVTANFEKELSESFNIKSFMIDASVNSAPIKDKNFEFEKKFLGSDNNQHFITLSNWVNEKVKDEDSNLMLQMDIEGSEYSVLAFEGAEILKRFSVMVIEFHSLHNLFEQNFYFAASAIFEKLYKDFSICHVHPNNCCGIEERSGVQIPQVIEVTFIRNDLIEFVSSEERIILPHKLDFKNVVSKNDITMPDSWWAK